MAKNRLNDYDQTASNNTDVGGVNITDQARPSVLADWVPQIMKQIADWVQGTYAVNDTATFVNAADATKVFRFTGENLTSGTTEIDAERISRVATSNDISGYLYGLTLSNNTGDSTNDIDIAAGRAMDSTGTEMIVLSAGITKGLDALWAVGTNQGGRDAGSVANGTWHVYLIKRMDTGVVDVLLSSSATTPTLPTSYTKYRRIGSVIRSGGEILPFVQDHDKFMLRTPVLDADVSNQENTAVLRALTVPSGLNVMADVHIRMVASTGWSGAVTSPSNANVNPSNFATHGGSAGTADRKQLSIRTDTSRQIRTRSSASDTTVQIWTWGWSDTRDS